MYSNSGLEQLPSNIRNAEDVIDLNTFGNSIYCHSEVLLVRAEAKGNASCVNPVFDLNQLLSNCENGVFDFGK
jgi:hypothetical protein